MGIFRAYDIRGIYGKDLTEEIMTKIGEAAGTLSQAPSRLEETSESTELKLEEAFVSGLKKTGSNANLVGTCPASLCVFANSKMNNNATAYITASHLPAEWNGVKFFHQDGVGFFEDENKKLGEISASEKFKTGTGTAKKIEGMDTEYANFVAEKIKPEKISVVADFGNGAACLLVPKILQENRC